MTLAVQLAALLDNIIVPQDKHEKQTEKLKEQCNYSNNIRIGPIGPLVESLSENL